MSTIGTYTWADRTITLTLLKSWKPCKTEDTKLALEQFQKVFPSGGTLCVVIATIDNITWIRWLLNKVRKHEDTNLGL